MCPTTFFALARATAEAAFVTVNSCWDRLKKNTILTTIPLCIASIKKNVQKSWTGDAVWHNTFSHLILILFLSVYWLRAPVFLSLPISHKSSSQDKWHHSHSLFHHFTIPPSQEWILHKEEAEKNQKEWPAALPFKETVIHLLWYSNSRGQHLNNAWKELEQSLVYYGNIHNYHGEVLNTYPKLQKWL